MRPFEEDSTSRFLASSKRLLGTGITTTRTSPSVNLDAALEEYRDVQCDGETIRLSQRKKKIYNYYLVLDNPQSADDEVLDKKIRGEMIRSSVYTHDEDGNVDNVEEDEVVAEK